MDGCPLGLGLVVEDKPTEFSCTRDKMTCLLLFRGADSNSSVFALALVAIYAHAIQVKHVDSAKIVH